MYLPMTVNMDSALAQGNRIKSAGLYSVQYFTTEYTLGHEDNDRRRRV